MVPTHGFASGVPPGLLRGRLRLAGAPVVVHDARPHVADEGVPAVLEVVAHRRELDVVPREGGGGGGIPQFPGALRCA